MPIDRPPDESLGNVYHPDDRADVILDEMGNVVETVAQRTARELVEYENDPNNPERLRAKRIPKNYDRHGTYGE